MMSLAFKAALLGWVSALPICLLVYAVMLVKKASYGA